MLYFISYAKHNGYGSYQLELDKPICSIKDIKKIEDRLMELTGGSDIAILYWRRFEESEVDCYDGNSDIM